MLQGGHSRRQWAEVGRLHGRRGDGNGALLQPGHAGFQAGERLSQGIDRRGGGRLTVWI